MSYISRLIEKAVDRKKENNKLGSYRIAPQHGSNVHVFHLYKNENWMCTINIFDGIPKINIQVSKNIKGRDMINTVSSIIDLYPSRLVATYETTEKSLKKV